MALRIIPRSEKRALMTSESDFLPLGGLLTLYFSLNCPHFSVKSAFLPSS